MLHNLKTVWRPAGADAVPFGGRVSGEPGDVAVCCLAGTVGVVSQRVARALNKLWGDVEGLGGSVLVAEANQPQMATPVTRAGVDESAGNTGRAYGGCCLRG